MLKLIGVILAFTAYISCLPGSNGKLVDEKNWVDFLDPHTGDGANSDDRRCPILPRCQALRRVTVSCDADSVSVGCGVCLAGFHEGDGGNCMPGSTGSGKLGSGMETDQLIDRLAAASAQLKEDADLQLAARAGGAAASSTSNGSAAGPAPPPPPARAPAGNEDFAFYVIIGTTCGLGLLLIVICAICWYKYNIAAKQADKDFANTGYATSSGSAGDGKLALSAQMYHYQHQKQQMIAMERSNSDLQRDISDDDSDLENDEADFTVYECPGLAPTKEMEVRNPFFKEHVEQSSSTSGPSTAEFSAAKGDAAS